MSSKICRVYGGIVVALSLALVMCARESAPSHSPINVQLKSDGRCLAEFGSNLKRFFNGQMTRPQVIEFWDCTAQAVNDYQRLTSGDAAGGKYTPQALRRFLYRYFFKTRPLSDTLLASLMEVKRVFLSGSVGEITREELQRLQALMVELKLLSLEIHPHVLVLFGEQRASDTEVDLAARSLERATQRIGRWLDVRQEPYSFHQLQTFVVELKNWIGREEGDAARQTIETIEQVLVLLPPAKKLLLSGDGARIEGTSWIVLMKALGHGFHIYLDFKHTFQDHMNAGFIRRTMPEALEETALVLEQAIRRRGGKGLPMSEWRELFEKVEQSKLMPPEFTADATYGAFQWLIVRALGRGAGTEFINQGHVRRLRHHRTVWHEVLARVNGEEFRQIPEIVRFDEILARSAPMQWDSEGRLEHVRQGPATWTQENRRRMVWPFVFINWLRDAYLKDGPVMSEEQISQAVNELLPMFQRFGWMQDTKLTVGKRVLREADLFTEASNGDFSLDMAEAVRYLAFVASGLRTAEIWLAEADQKCGSRDAICVREIATLADSRAMEALPQLRAAILKQGPANFINYMKKSEETVLGQVTVGPMSTKGILQTFQLFQYVETFLRIYDSDQSQKINLPEAVPAFDRYGPTLAKLLNAGQTPKDEILAFFTFMMKYGDTPFSMFGGQVLYNHWKWHRNDWAFEAERGTLMGILNQLSKL